MSTYSERHHVGNSIIFKILFTFRLKMVYTAHMTCISACTAKSNRTVRGIGQILTCILYVH